jgi:cell shape-determining protein MreC
VPVGTVLDVKAGYPFKQVRVMPAAKLDRLEEVFVLLTQEPLEFQKEAEAQSAPAQSTPAPSVPAATPATGPPAAVKP